MTNLYISRTKNTRDDWRTPDYFFNLLDQEFHFTLDAAASKKNAKCKKFYTKETNGLIQDWKGETVFVNPPFSHMEEWAQKCYNEGQKKNTTVVMLMPHRTDTGYWYDYVMKAHEIWFCKGRVHFIKNGTKPDKNTTFGLCVIIFKITDNKHPPAIPFLHMEKDLIKYKTIDEFCRSEEKKVRERQLISNNGGKPRQK